MGTVGWILAAIQLAQQGARVVINDINLPDAEEAAQATVEDIKGFGGEAIAVFGDCADTQARLDIRVGFVDNEVIRKGRARPALRRCGRTARRNRRCRHWKSRFSRR